MKTIATVPGTATQTIEIIMNALEIGVNIIENIEDVAMSKHDGLLLLGGRDINPTWYGEAQVYAQNPDKRRDYLEWTLIRRAMTKGIPIMGICRGAQLLAVAHGGSLWQDVNKQTGKNHPQSGTHAIEIQDKLGIHIPTDRVNSLHHQSIRFVPPGLKTLAMSPDGWCT